MKTSMDTIMVATMVAVSALRVQAQQLGIATICAGAATLNNGSIVTIGQPFVGMMGAPGGGITLNPGIIPALTRTATPSPVMPPMLSSGVWHSGGIFAFQFPTQPGHNYVVQASTNLTMWTPVSTNLGDGTSFLFRDSNAVFYPRRFYRVESW